MPRRYRPSLVILGTAFVLISFMMIVSGVAKAEVAGTWSSTVYGEGYFDHTYPADYYYEATLTLSGSGSSVTGSLTLYCTDVVVNVAGWESALDRIGQTFTSSVTGTESGSSFTMYVHASSGTYTYQLTVADGKMTGSGQYTDAAMTVNHWTFDLTSGGGGSGSFGGFPELEGIALGVAAIGATVGLAASIMPVPKPPVPTVRRIPPYPIGQTQQQYSTGPAMYPTRYAPGDAREYATQAGPIQPGGMPITGAGASIPIEYVNGIPVRPKVWPRLYGPACPIHGTPCTPHYTSDVDYPGCWVCQTCRDQGIGVPPGFPWGFP